MKSAAAILLILASCVVANAQLQRPDTSTARSKTGQFVVHRADSVVITAPRPGEKSDDNALILQPSLVAVSCERVKHAVWDSLGVSGPWKGSVFIEVRPARNANQPVTIFCDRFADGWNYRLEMPQLMERRRYLHSIVQAVLLELANRDATKRSAEMPDWLVEGLSQHLLESSRPEFMLNPPTMAVHGLLVSPTTVRKNPTDPLAKARKTLRENPEFTLEQLSWPTDAQLNGEDGGIYRDNAQVFVAELLRFKDGQACLNAMLKELPQCYNWQTAFLRGFKPHFTALLDVEKWWALQVVYVSGRDPTRLSTTEESWRKLDAALLTPAQTRKGTNDIPSPTDLNLQSVITVWNYSDQRRALDEKIRLLDVFRLRLATDAALLAVEYRDVLTDYLKRRHQAAFSTSDKRFQPATAKSVQATAVKKLDELDAKRTALKARPATATQ
jgi:hypothetical protein